MIAIRLISSEIAWKKSRTKPTRMASRPGQMMSPPALPDISPERHVEEERPAQIDHERREGQQHEDVAEDVDPVAHPLRKRVRDDVDADVLVALQRVGGGDEERPAEQYHCSSSQAFELMSKALRMMALPALTRIASRISQLTERPRKAVTRSIARCHEQQRHIGEIVRRV